MTQAPPSTLSIPPDVQERLRARRPGYDRVSDLVRQYDEFAKSNKSQMSEAGTLESNVQRLFDALGWMTTKIETVVEPSDEQPRVRFDVSLHYQDIRIPVEIKSASAELAQARERLFASVQTLNNRWGVLTNFETIQLFSFQRPLFWVETLPYLETSPYAYLTDEDEKHDILAAPIFYERLVKAQSPDINSSPIQQASQQTTQPPNNQTTQPPSPPTTERLEVASRALADAPSAVDLLGFSDYAEALADFIKSEKTQKPLTIGIDAPWGMGKTTLMQMIRERLVVRDGTGKVQRTFPTVWFNAWRFDEEQSLWAALALAILNETRKQLRWQQRVRLWFASRLSGVRQMDLFAIAQNVVKLTAYIIILLGIGYAAVAVLQLDTTLPESMRDLQTRGGIIGTLAFIASVYLAGRELLERVLKSFNIRIEQLSDSSKAVTAERVNFLSQFDEEFKTMAALLTEGGKWPIVVFIDDLERCTPPRPAEIMEAINLFLGSEYTVFVLGMDAQMVAGSIESKYAALKSYLADVEETAGVTLGQRFVEKIVQLNFQIPRSDPERFASFINANLLAHQSEATAPAAPVQVAQAEQLIKAEQRAGITDLDAAVRAVQAKQSDLPASAIAQARQEIFAQSFDDSDEVRKAIALATPYMGFNPRKLKRFINNFRLQALVTNRRGLLHAHAIELPLLAKWMIIVTRWPDLVDALEADVNAIKNLREAYSFRTALDAAQRDPNLYLLLEPKARVNAQTVEQLSKLAGESQAADEQAQVKSQMPALNARLSQLLADKRLSRLVNSADLTQLLHDMRDDEIEALPTYLQVAHVGAGV